MHHKDRITSILVIMICLLVTGCGDNQINRPISTLLPTPTSTSLPTLTSAPSSTPTLKPTLTPLPTPDVKIELMKQVTLFLNSEEPYRENEDLYWIVFRPHDTRKNPKLGIIDALVENGVVNLQGIFLGFIESTNGIVLLLGVQDKNGERFVTPLKLYDQIFDMWKETSEGFPFLVRTKDYSNFLGEPIIIKSKEEAKYYLSTKTGQIFGIQLALLPAPALTEENNAAMLKLGYSNPELFVKQFEGFRSSFFELNKDLAASLWIPSSDYWDARYGGFSIAQNLNMMGKASGTAIEITSADDIDQVLQIEWLPSPDHIAGSSRWPTN